MTTLKALIIDDEARARRTLAALLEEFCEAVEVAATAGSVDEGLSKFAEQSFDVIFLDVSMPEKDGFALAEMPELRDQAIVFVTAHADFALNAFRVNAVDYLLKPVNVQHLRTAIDRVRRLHAENAGSARASLRFFAEGEHRLVPLADVLYLEADGSYVYVQTTSHRHLVSRGLKAFEQRLLSQSFLRTHRSFLVNLAHVVSVGTLQAATVTLDSGHEVPLSRYRRGELVKALEM